MSWHVVHDASLVVVCARQCLHHALGFRAEFDPVYCDLRRNVIHQVFEAIKGVPEDAYYRQSVEATLQDKYNSLLIPFI